MERLAFGEGLLACSSCSLRGLCAMRSPVTAASTKLMARDRCDSREWPPSDAVQYRVTPTVATPKHHAASAAARPPKATKRRGPLTDRRRQRDCQERVGLRTGRRCRRPSCRPSSARPSSARAPRPAAERVGDAAGGRGGRRRCASRRARGVLSRRHAAPGRRGLRGERRARQRPSCRRSPARRRPSRRRASRRRACRRRSSVRRRRGAASSAVGRRRRGSLAAARRLVVLDRRDDRLLRRGRRGRRRTGGGGSCGLRGRVGLHDELGDAEHRRRRRRRARRRRGPSCVPFGSSQRRDDEAALDRGESAGLTVRPADAALRGGDRLRGLRLGDARRARQLLVARTTAASRDAARRGRGRAAAAFAFVSSIVSCSARCCACRRCSAARSFSSTRCRRTLRSAIDAVLAEPSTATAARASASASLPCRPSSWRRSDCSRASPSRSCCSAAFQRSASAPCAARPLPAC